MNTNAAEADDQRVPAEPVTTLAGTASYVPLNAPEGTVTWSWSLKRGQPTRATFKQLCAAAAPREFDLHINLNLGRSSALMYASDLTEEYVIENSEYTT